MFLEVYMINLNTNISFLSHMIQTIKMPDCSMFISTNNTKSNKGNTYLLHLECHCFYIESSLYEIILIVQNAK